MNAALTPALSRKREREKISTTVSKEPSLACGRGQGEGLPHPGIRTGSCLMPLMKLE